MTAAERKRVCVKGDASMVPDQPSVSELLLILEECREGERRYKEKIASAAIRGDRGKLRHWLVIREQYRYMIQLLWAEIAMRQPTEWQRPPPAPKTPRLQYSECSRANAVLPLCPPRRAGAAHGALAN